VETRNNFPYTIRRKCFITILWSASKMFIPFNPSTSINTASSKREANKANGFIAQPPISQYQ